MPTPSPSPRSGQPAKGITMILGWVKELSNLVPDPLVLFFLLAVVTLGMSAIAAYSLAFLASWVFLLICWYGLNLPLSPNAPIQM